jgi:hypothetical protein
MDFNGVAHPEWGDFGLKLLFLNLLNNVHGADTPGFGGPNR